MNTAELHAVTVRLDALRDIMIELVAALPPDRVAGFAAAVSARMNDRIAGIDVDERTDDALLSEVAPVFAALSHRSLRDSTPSCASPQRRCGISDPI